MHRFSRIGNTDSEVIKLTDNRYANHCIVCTVESCRHHNDSKNYCSLEAIRVGAHESDPNVPPCTDCQSFVPRSAQ